MKIWALSLFILPFASKAQTEIRIRNLNTPVFNALIRVKQTTGTIPMGQYNAEGICTAIFSDKKIDTIEMSLIDNLLKNDKKFFVEPGKPNPYFPQVFFEKSVQPEAKNIFNWFLARMELKSPVDSLANRLFFEQGNDPVAEVVRLSYMEDKSYEMAFEAVRQYLGYYLQNSSQKDKYALFRDRVGGLYFSFSLLSNEDFKNGTLLLYKVASTINEENGNKIDPAIYDWVIKEF